MAVSHQGSYGALSAAPGKVLGTDPGTGRVHTLNSFQVCKEAHCGLEEPGCHSESWILMYTKRVEEEYGSPFLVRRWMWR